MSNSKYSSVVSRGGQKENRFGSNMHRYVNNPFAVEKAIEHISIEEHTLPTLLEFSQPREVKETFPLSMSSMDAMDIQSQEIFTCTPVDQPIAKRSLADHRETLMGARQRQPQNSLPMKRAIGLSNTLPLIPKNIRVSPCNENIFLPKFQQASPKSHKRNILLQMPDSIISSKFEVIKDIGKGSFGSVRKVRSKFDGCIYAVKRIFKKQNGRGMREVFALSRIAQGGNCPSIIRYYDAWIDNNEVYIQTECCDGSLEGVHATEDMLWRILHDISGALKHVHSLGLAHLDLKPANILISNSDNTFKLADFGLVSEIECSPSQEVVEGDARYLSAEILSNCHSITLDKADLYALGLTLYELAGGVELPSTGAEWHRIREQGLHPLEFLSAPLAKIISQLCSTDPSQRPSAASIYNESNDGLIHYLIEENRKLTSIMEIC